MGAARDTDAASSRFGSVEDRYRRTAAAFGLLAMAIGTLVLVGWWGDVAAFRSVLPGLVSMKVNTAAGFVVAGGLLASRASRAPHAAAWRDRAERSLGGLLVLLGLLTLFEYASGASIGIDQLLAREVPGAVGTAAPGRMAALTAAALLLLGSALTLGADGRARSRAVAVLNAGAATLVVASVLGYALGDPAGGSVGTSMAIHTAVGLAILVFGIAFLAPDHGLLGLLRRPTGGGLLARRLLPGLLVLPVVVEVAQRLVAEHGILSTTVAAILHIAIYMWILGLVAVVAAIYIDRVNARVEISERRFRATFEQAAVGVAHVRLDGRWLRVNDRLASIVGYTADELYPMTFQDITHPDDLDADLANVALLLAGSISSYQMEKRYRRKEGTLVEVNLTVSLVRDVGGAPAFFVAIIEDISARKTAERRLAAEQEPPAPGHPGRTAARPAARGGRLDP